MLVTILKYTWKSLLAVAIICSALGAYAGYTASSLKKFERELSNSINFFSNFKGAE